MTAKANAASKLALALEETAAEYFRHWEVSTPQKRNITSTSHPAVEAVESINSKEAMTLKEFKTKIDAFLNLSQPSNYYAALTEYQPHTAKQFLHEVGLFSRRPEGLKKAAAIQTACNKLVVLLEKVELQGPVVQQQKSHFGCGFSDNG